MARRITPTPAATPAATADPKPEKAGETAAEKPTKSRQKRERPKRCKTTGRVIQRTERQLQAIEMRRAGKTLQQIGEAVKADKSTVHRWIGELLAEVNAKVTDGVDALKKEMFAVIMTQLVPLREAFHDPTTSLKDRLDINREIVRLLNELAKYFGLHAQPEVLPPSDGQQVSIQVNQQINVGETVREAIIHEPDFIEFVRQRAVAADCDPRLICADDQRGTVEAGPSPGGPRSGSNGHANGNGRH